MQLPVVNIGIRILNRYRTGYETRVDVPTFFNPLLAIFFLLRNLFSALGVNFYKQFALLEEHMVTPGSW